MKVVDNLNIISKNLKITKKQKNVFKSLKRGDIFLAKNQYFRVDFKNVSFAKQYINYLVIYKDLNNIYALKLSDNKDSETNNMDYCIKTNKYKEMDRDYFVDMDEVYKIPICDIAAKKFSIDIEDQKQIKRRLSICKEKISGPYNDTKFDLDVPLEIFPGDVILVNNFKYLVYFVTLHTLACFKLLEHDYNKKFKLSINGKSVFDRINDIMQVVVNGNKYYIEYKKVRYFNKIPKFSLLEFATKEEIEVIERNLIQQKERLDGLNVENKYDIGTVFDINGERIIYLFSANGKDYGIDIKKYKENPILREFCEIANYDIIDEDFKKEYIENLFESKVEPLAPIEDIYVKYNDWYRHFDE